MVGVSLPQWITLIASIITITCNLATLTLRR
jgi:hypothetical protein